MQQHEKFRQYSAMVCDQIRWKKAHGVILEEIENHLNDRTTALMESGLDEQSAIDKAIIEMGDPIEVGSQLDRTHRPKPEWSIIGLTVLALFIGFCIRLIIPSSSTDSGDYIGSSLLIVAIGFACMFAAYTIDFTIIGRHPIIFYGILVIVSVVCLILNPFINSSGRFIVNGRVTSVQYLLLIYPTAFAGILYCLRNKGYLSIIVSGFFYALPAVIGIAATCTSSVFFYSVTCLMLLTYAICKGWFNVRKILGISLVYGLSFIALLFLFRIFIYSSDYRLDRVRAFISPPADSYMTYGYIPMLIRNTIKGARLFGGGDYLSASSLTLPGYDTEYLMTYLIDRFGFAALILIMTVLTAFIIRMILLSKRQTSVLGKLISTAVILTLSIQITAYVANNFGFQLFSTLPLPFIVQGGMATITNMTLIGIILSVFKSGKLVKDYQSFASTSNKKFLQIIDGKIIIDISFK